MSRSGAGTYTLPAAYNPVVTLTTIQSAWANTTLSDIAAELTDSLSRSGKGGMSAALKLAEGTKALPALTWNTETNSGFWRYGTRQFSFGINDTELIRYTVTLMTLYNNLYVTGTTTTNGKLRVNDTTSDIAVGASFVRIGFRGVPKVAALADGCCYTTNAGFTINTTDLAAGTTYTILNDSDVAITIAQGVGVTLRLAGTTGNGNITVDGRGLCTIWCYSGTVAYASGPGVYLA